MERMIKDTNQYFHCEREKCNFKSKKSKKLIFFKGKHLCKNCRNKVSLSTNYIPKLNPSESTLKRHTSLPREVKPKQPRLRKRIQFYRARSVTLTKEEIKLLKDHFYERGLSDKEIYKNIDSIKQNIKKSHELYKEGTKENKPTFQEEFEKLINKDGKSIF